MRAGQGHPLPGAPLAARFCEVVLAAAKVENPPPELVKALAAVGIVPPAILDRQRALEARAAEERRTQTDGPGEPDPAFAGLRLDPTRHGATAGDAFADLTRTEYQLLELFLHHPGQVLTRDVIYDRVWGYDFGPASNSLRVYVGYLRRKLARIGAAPIIATVHGVGYVLREP